MPFFRLRRPSSIILFCLLVYFGRFVLPQNQYPTMYHSDGDSGIDESTYQGVTQTGQCVNDDAGRSIEGKDAIKW